MNMLIRNAKEDDKSEIVELYEKSQSFTGIPNPDFYPPSDLGKRLYDIKAIERIVAIEVGKIVGHALIEEPNPDNIESWMKGIKEFKPLAELGGAFVDPYFSRQGIWTKLLEHRLTIVRDDLDSIPVSATWMENEHVKSTFKKYGGAEVAIKQVLGGRVSLYVFE